MPLTDSACRNAKARGKDYNISDGGGLHLLIKHNGSKLWRLSYRVDHKQKTLSLGPYPSLSLADARDLRGSAKRKLSFGIDPALEKKGRAAAEATEANITFGAVARDWFKVWQQDKNDAHIARVWSRLERDALPEIGNLPIDEVDAPNLLAMIRKVEDRGALDISKRLRQTVGQIFGYAIAVGLAKYDPTPGLRRALKKGPKVKHFVKVPMKELPTFLAKMSNYDGDDMTRLALTFTLLTWVRTNEVRFAAWSEFEDLDGRDPIWRISAERMKMRREHFVPLSPQAVSILKQVPRSDRSDFVFWSDTKSGVISENTMIFALYRLGYKSRQTVHGFRRLASTWGNEEVIVNGESIIRRYHEDWIEMQLAHSEDDDSRGAYNAAEYLLPRRRMLADWADMIDRNLAAGLNRRRNDSDLI